MAIIRLKGKALDVFTVSSDKCTLIGPLANLTAPLPYPEVSLLLDSEHYFHTERRDELIRREIEGRGMAVSHIISLPEAMAAYAKSQFESIENFCFLHINDGLISRTVLTVKKGGYQLRKYTHDTGLKIDHLIKTHLNIQGDDIDKFEKFLLLPENSDNNKLLLELVTKAEKGEKLEPAFDEILSVFNGSTAQWGNIRMTSLAKLKSAIGSELQEEGAKTVFWGDFSMLFNDVSHTEVWFSDVWGAHYYRSQSNGIYSDLAQQVDIQIYCYPSLYRIPLFEKHSKYVDYSKPQKLRLFNTGQLTFFFGEREIVWQSKEKVNKPEPTEISAHIDGNQNLSLLIGKKQYLLTTHE